jgi:transposase
MVFCINSRTAATVLSRSAPDGPARWVDLPKDLPPYSTVFWHYKQWREEKIFDAIKDVLHGRVREQVKKNLNGQP